MNMPRLLFLPALLFLLLCLLNQSLQGQTYNFSQYMNTSAALNPSLPALEQEMAVRLNYRMQSVGNWNAIQSFILTAYYPWLASKKRGPTATAGLMLHHDKVAPANGLSFLSVGIPFSFSVGINKEQRLSFGFMPVFNSHQMNHDGLSTISQYSKERGYNPSLPLNEPLLDAQASYISWNAGLSWKKRNKREELISAAGFSASNLNQPHEQFQSYRSRIPMAFQAFLTTSMYHDRYIRLMPEIFFSSYGSHYQWQAGANLNYNLRYTNLRQGNLNIRSRYNWGRAVVVSTMLEQPTYAIGFSIDMYTKYERPFTQAFEVSLALKQGVIGRLRKFVIWPFGRESKSKRSSQFRKRKAEIDIPFLSHDQRKGLIPLFANKLPKLPVLPLEMVFNPTQGTILLNADDSIIKFATASSKLQESSVQHIKTIADFLLNHPDYKILIVGHTDDIGNPAFNKRLSLERATSVAAILHQEGVQPARIHTEGPGMKRPLLPNTTNKNRAMNRRVEFLLYRE